MVSETHNSTKLIEREKSCTNVVSVVLLLIGPISVWSLFGYFNATKSSSETYGLSTACINRTPTMIAVSFISFFFCSFLITLQLLLLFVASRVYLFRAQLLFSAMLLNEGDGGLVDTELTANTTPAKRALLAKAPHRTASPLATAAMPYIHRPFTPSSVNVESTHLRLNRVDKYLTVYRCIVDEAASHAKSWGVPIAIFLVVYVFVFFITCVALMRSMISNPSGNGQPIRLEIVYAFLTIAYIVVTLVPIIAINSTWTRHMAKPEAMMSRWSHEERIVLSAYFTQHPLLFPVLGVTVTWNKVIVLVGTACAPLLANAAVTAIYSSGVDPCGGGGCGNSTRV
jgi:hypothetical protein